jgi:hypothetical protein
MMFQFQKSAGLWIHVSPSLETGCSPYSFTMIDRNRSATNIFRSFDILSERISLSFGSLTTQSHINSEPVFTTVLSMIHSLIFFSNFFGLYF